MPAVLLSCLEDYRVSGGAESDAGRVDDASTETTPPPGGDAATDAAPDAPPPGAPGAPTGVTAAAVPVVVTVSTLAGSTSGFLDATGAAARFSDPRGVAVGPAGNIYVADTGNHRIRRITPAGVVTTLAGSGTGAFANGTGAAASFFIPMGVAVDDVGNVIVGDAGNQRIRRVTPAGVVTTLAGSGTAAFADGTGAAASFSGPGSVAVDLNKNVYVSDSTNHRIRIVTAGGVVSTVAGSGTSTFADGTGAAASFSFPAGIAVDGGNVWVADSSNHRIRKITSAGTVSTLAGSSAFNPIADGIGAAARFSGPQGVALDRALNAYVSDQNHQSIRKVTNAGVVTTLAGSGTAGLADGPAATATFSNPAGIAVDADANVYVADGNNNRIRKIASVGIRALVVTWTAPSAGTSAITGYRAEATAAGFAPQSCTTLGATSCTIVGLTSGVGYSVAVTARNAVGTGAPSVSSIGTPN